MSKAHSSAAGRSGDAPPTPPAPRTRGARIALTGGPGGGKTTAADLFRRELGDAVILVPEAATLLFGGGFPRRSDAASCRATQSAIFSVQRALEDIQSASWPERILLCDRGTIDGAAYWPAEDGGALGFFTSAGTTLEAELARYDAVIFFQSAATGGMSIDGGNPVRSESQREAALLDDKLLALWSQHERFVLVPHKASFFKKITFGLAAIESIVAQLRRLAQGPTG